MEFIDFYAKEDDKNRRIDKVIRKMAKFSTLSSIYSAIRKGLIRVNEKKIKEDLIIQTNDKISIAKFLIDNKKIILDQQFTSKEKNINSNITCTKQKTVEIIFQNEFVKIINKPYNKNVHGDNGLSKQIESIYYSENKNKSLSFVPGPLHRLDKKTTGLLVFSNNLEGAQYFSKAIREKQVRKFYIGICQGNMQHKQIWNDYIEQDNKQNSTFFTMRIVSKSENNLTKENDLATTICTPLAHGIYKNKEITLCQFEIKTGKKHQIRCQSSFHNFALLGDTAYNAIAINEKQDLFLHAYKLIFPKENKIKIPEILTAPISKNFTDFLNQTLIKWNGSLIIDSE